jgi:hypothetical protein
MTDQAGGPASLTDHLESHLSLPDGWAVHQELLMHVPIADYPARAGGLRGLAWWALRHSARLGARRDQRCRSSSATMNRATSPRVIRQPFWGVQLSTVR